MGCAIVLGLYGRSAVHPGVAVYTPVGYVGVSDGLVSVAWWPLPPPGRPRMALDVGPFGFQIVGMRWWFAAAGTLSSGWVRVPIWALMAPVIGLAVMNWRARRCAGHCAACGYDLTGNEGRRCPECGRGGEG